MYALSKDCASVPSLLAYSSQEVFVCGGVKEPSYFSLGPSSTLGNEKLLSLFYFPPKSHADASNKLLIRAFKRKAMVCVGGRQRMVLLSWKTWGSILRTHLMAHNYHVTPVLGDPIPLSGPLGLHTCK